jgi:hypothetical protein
MITISKWITIEIPHSLLTNLLSLTTMHKLTVTRFKLYTHMISWKKLYQYKFLHALGSVFCSLKFSHILPLWSLNLKEETFTTMPTFFLLVQPPLYACVHVPFIIPLSLFDLCWAHICDFNSFRGIWCDCVNKL